jgi:hypothetical protein
MPLLRRAGGAIVNISSVSGLVGGHNLAAYNASKGGVRLLTKSVALHGARQKPPVRCNSVHPAFIEGPMADGMIAQFRDPVRARERLSASVPLGRFGAPAEVAELCVYLLGDESAFVTGAELTSKRESYWGTCPPQPTIRAFGQPQKPLPLGAFEGASANAVEFCLASRAREIAGDFCPVAELCFAFRFAFLAKRPREIADTAKPPCPVSGVNRRRRDPLSRRRRPGRRTSAHRACGGAEPCPRRCCGAGPENSAGAARCGTGRAGELCAAGCRARCAGTSACRLGCT